MAACLSCMKTMSSSNPRAKYCDSTCRVNACKKRKQGLPEARPSAGVTVTPGLFGGPGLCESAALAELTEAGRESTTLGRACLVLAARIDLNADTGSALAGAIRQLEASMAAATKGARVERTALDELRSRRDAKRGA